MKNPVRTGNKMDVKQLLEKRRRLKRKKPEFVRQDAHKKKKVGWKWRKPKGSDSKMRVRKKGYRRSVETGWGSPSAVKGLAPAGLEFAYVSTVKDLEGLDKNKHVVVIRSSVGLKKRLEIIEKTIALGIKQYNYKDPAKYAETVKKELSDKKTAKENQKQEREKKKEDAKKAAEKKAKKEKEEKKAADKEEEMTEEEKKAEEKKERDKLLISTE